MSITLKGQQPQAFDAVMRWWKTPAHLRSQVFRIYGGAGTGKTTVAKKFAEMAKCHFMTLSGKAALVMRKKGCDGATTVHSAIYRLVDEDGDQPHFELNLDSELIRNCDLIVLDELGMIGTDIGEDIMAFGKPVLALGDLNQLPPPSGQESYFMGAKPDFLFTEILRQAADSPIIRLAYEALELGRLVPGKYGDSCVYSSSVKDSKVQEVMLAADQVLCGKNATRTYNSALMRKWRGLVGEQADYLPTVGERVVCVRNNHKKGILNGEQFIVDKILDRDLGKVFAFGAVSLDTGSDRVVELEVPWNWWAGTEGNLPMFERANFDQVVHAGCMTVHKYQGSQENHIAILDESAVFKEHRRKHLYTAITRAAEKVDIFL